MIQLVSNSRSLMVCILFAGCLIMTTGVKAQHRMLIHFESSTHPDTIDALKTELSAVELDISPISDIRLWELPDSVFIGTDTLGLEESVRYASRRTQVKEVGPDYITFIPMYFENHQFPVPCPLPILIPGDSNSVLVGLVDSGIDTAHDFFDGLPYFWNNPDEIPGDGADNDGNGFTDDFLGYNFYDSTAYPVDSNGHGTHIAGTMSLLFDSAGAPNIRIVNLRTQSPEGRGNLYDAILAIDYAIAKGVDILNLSMGYRDSLGVQDTIRAPMEHALEVAGDSVDMLIVAAAGNDSTNIDSKPFFPAAFGLPNILSVAASTCFDTLADFSNYGDSTVDLAAPGVNILSSTLPLSTVGFKSGTSMACGIVTSVAALLSSHTTKPTPPAGTVNYALKAPFIKDLLLESVDLPPPLAGLLLTEGRINALRALDSLLVRVASVRGLAWDDVNGDGVRDGSEAALPGLAVSLMDPFGNFVTSTLTGSSGEYNFHNLVPGTYAISFSAAPGFFPSPQNQGANDSLDSDVNPRSGVAWITLTERDSLSEVDGGFSLTPDLLIETRIFLEGGYESADSLMRSDLDAHGHLPGSEPYTALGYSLTQGMGSSLSLSLLGNSSPSGIVDWVLVELRLSIDSSVVAGSAPALLQRNGEVIAPDGSAFRFSDLSPANYFVSVRHRNHHDIMSQTARWIDADSQSIDFRDSTTQVFDSDARKILATGATALRGGDSNGDGLTNASDRSAVWNQRNLSGYRSADFSLDGVVNAADRSLVWNNRNQSSPLP